MGIPARGIPPMQGGDCHGMAKIVEMRWSTSNVGDGGAETELLPDGGEAHHGVDVARRWTRAVPDK